MPGKKHSTRRLWDGFSGEYHSKPSSSTALDRTWERLASMPGLDALGCADCEGAGSLFEPDSSLAFEAKSSNSPSSLPPNDTRSLAAAEGCWSRRVKRTGEMSMCHWLYEETHITKVVKFRPSERCFSVGGAVINGVQGPKKAGLTKMARHLQQSRKICYFMKCSGKRESPDSGRESMDQLLHARTAGC